jgi:hypothetical protein
MGCAGERVFDAHEVCGVIAILLSAMSPLPPPTPIPLDHHAVCKAYTSDGLQHDIKIDLKFERSYGRMGHWWTIDGDPLLFPSNKSFRNMFTYDDGGYDRSRAAFSVGDQFYTYVLSFRVGVADQEYGYGSFGNIQVYRRDELAGSEADIPVAIGFCKIETTKATVK